VSGHFNSQSSTQSSTTPNAKSFAEGRAHAKLILLGEHFVVPWTDSENVRHPGTPAIAVPVPSLRTTVKLEAGIQKAAEDFDPRTREAIKRAATIFGWDLDRNPLVFSSENGFPLSRGLGSSACFSAALCQAFSELTGKHPEQGLRESAQMVENIFHGQSSGLDTAAVVSENPILFRGQKDVHEFKNVAVDLVILDSGSRQASSSLVSKTMEIRKQEPHRWRAYCERVNQLVAESFEALQSRDGAEKFATSINANQTILSEIGLVTDQAREILSTGLKLGALGGKISGAGLGGVLFFATRSGEGASLADKLRQSGQQILAVVS
jgi:mevalonate kinase